MYNAFLLQLWYYENYFCEKIEENMIFVHLNLQTLLGTGYIRANAAIRYKITHEVKSI